MVTLTIQRARELLGDKANSLPDEKIQTKIDIMLVLANRCYDMLSSQKAEKERNVRTG